MAILIKSVDIGGRVPNLIKYFKDKVGCEVVIQYHEIHNNPRVLFNHGASISCEYFSVFHDYGSLIRQTDNTPMIETYIKKFEIEAGRLADGQSSGWSTTHSLVADFIDVKGRFEMEGKFFAWRAL